MEKWQREQLDNAIKERGIEFLNNVLNMVSNQKDNENKFIKDILEIDREEAKEIIEKYTDLANMLRYTFGMYRSNIDYFNTDTLQINSIISTSLTIEQHIQDLLNNKDIFSNEVAQIHKDSLDRAYKMNEEIKRDFLYWQEHPEKMKKDRYKLQIALNEILNTDTLLKTIKRQQEEKEKQVKNIMKEIKEAEQNEYYIEKISNDNEFHYLFRGAILDYVSNDVIEGVRDKFFKEYKIKIIDRKPKTERVHCLKSSAYPYTKKRIEKLMQFYLIDNKEQKANKKMLFIFDLFTNLEERTKQENYKNILKKHIKIAYKEMEEEEEKTSTLACCVLSHAEEIMQEMGWFNIE